MNATIMIGPLKKVAAKLKPRNDDDPVDRLHNVISPTVFLFLAIVIGCKQFVGQPIQCWPPAEFKKHWMQYAEGYCFVENTYYVGMDERFPAQPIERERRQIHYYQWVVFILMGMAFLMVLPKLLWNAFNWKSGLDIRSLVERARELCAKGEFEGREKAGRELAKRIGGGLQHQQRKKTTRMDGNGGQKVPEYLNTAETMPSARYVTVLWIILKALNLVVVLVLLQLLTTFLDNSGDQQYWGVAVLQDLWAGRNWRQSGAFPRVTFCDFHIRQPQRDLQPIRYSLQCVLMINMMNEKIFLFCWFWLLGLSIVGTANLLLWLYRAFVWSTSYEFVATQLRLANAKVPSPTQLHQFVQGGLSLDGVTVLRLISLNCGPQICAQLTKFLWHRYRNSLLIGFGKAALLQRPIKPE